MIKNPLALLIAIAALTITTADANWVYLTPGFDWYGYRDAYGVTHAWQADAARYDFQVEIHGRWLSVGTDIYQLSD